MGKEQLEATPLLFFRMLMILYYFQIRMRQDAPRIFHSG